MTENFFDKLPTSIPKELIEVLSANQHVRIERIVSHGHVSPEGFWYDQVEHEWVIILKGAARLRFEDSTLELKPGDFVNIPAHRRHRVEWTTALLMASVTVLAANWLIGACSVLVLELLAVRTPKQERMLIEKFGQQYQDYMENTGKFFPRILSGK